jgi:hypothetical protein
MLMNSKNRVAAHPASRLPLLIAAILLMAACVFSAAFATRANDADAKSERRITLGSGTKNLKPNCGRDFTRDCTVEGKVTAYQLKRTDSSKPQPYVVPWAGKIVSWSISLARPTKNEIVDDGVTRPAQSPFFNELFGSPATAGISVLRRVNKNKKGAPYWRMVRHSPVQILNPYFGTTVRFVLEKPLNVIPKQIVALTIPTWAPALWKPAVCNFDAITGVKDPGACRVAENNYTWRGSRAVGKCRLGTDPDTGEPNEALEKTRPQQKVDSIRRYGCFYGSNALLYTATIVGKN